jgi:hypothetical protein
MEGSYPCLQNWKTDLNPRPDWGRLPFVVVSPPSRSTKYKGGADGAHKPTFVVLQCSPHNPNPDLISEGAEAMGTPTTP